MFNRGLKIWFGKNYSKLSILAFFGVSFDWRSGLCHLDFDDFITHRQAYSSTVFLDASFLPCSFESIAGYAFLRYEHRPSIVDSLTSPLPFPVAAHQELNFCAGIRFGKG
jgi:hypothetical protein